MKNKIAPMTLDPLKKSIHHSIVTFFLLMTSANTSALTTKQTMIIEEGCEQVALTVMSGYLYYRHYSENDRENLNRLLDAYENSRHKINFHINDVIKMKKLGFELRQKNIESKKRKNQKETQEDYVRNYSKVYEDCTQNMRSSFENGDIE